MAPAANDPAQDAVLLIDDDRSLAELLSIWLEDAGFAVRAVASGEEGLDELSRMLPDAICLDLGLPGLSGQEILTRIKDHHPRIPVVILTADDTVDSVVAAMQAGAHDYIPKPVGETRLVTTIRHAVDQHRMAVELASLEREVSGEGFRGLVGRSAPMQELFRQLSGSPRATSRSSSRARAGPARSWWPGRSTRAADGPEDPSWR